MKDVDQAVTSATFCAASLWRDGWRRVWSVRLNRACLLMVAVYTGIAFYGEAVYQISRHRDVTPSYQKTNLEKRYLAPSFVRSRSWRTIAEHPLGTDNLGRDVLQRLVQGTRIAFHVGVMTSLIALPLGLVLGCLAGYFGGRVDTLVVWLYSTVAAMPGLLFILAIAMIAGKGLTGIYLGIGLTTWVGICRLVRAEVMKHRDLAYVEAARVLGFSDLRILFGHILPNIFHLVIVVFSLRFPAAVGTEVFISFLGIGVQHEPSWGVMINNARIRLWQGIWWEMTFVSMAILLLVLSFNLLGDALRDAFDPRLREGTPD